MCQQHLSNLSMEGHEPEGLQTEGNLAQSKRHFLASVSRSALRSLSRIFCPAPARESRVSPFACSYITSTIEIMVCHYITQRFKIIGRDRTNSGL